MLSFRKLNTSAATRRRPRKVAEDPARSVPPGEGAAARPSSGKEIGLPAAATKTKTKMKMMRWRKMRPTSRSFRRQQRFCA